VKCRQVRFRYCDENMPVFLDLFIFDYVIDADHTVFDRMQQDRRRFIESLDSDPELEFWEQEDRCYTGQDEEGGSLLAAHFNAAVEQEGDASGIIAPSRDQAKGVMWAIDNLDSFDGLDWISSLDDVWPLQRVDFEGIRVNAMAHLDEYVAMHYGDYYTLPKMLASERNHLGQALEDPAVAQALGEAASSMEDVT
ncbi:MAG: hypothetical protein IJ131_04910, partial [Eggerthellaceae bacterium]|nr:hypothetical protein [Eggerthellaceae bacterium]